ncbi:MAG: T9SS type A sorting domain-containing protein [Lewinellaceae bacterium]|nr:T9SS type A sorting domain-containing protein [Lewinellaceae bacterium]
MVWLGGSDVTYNYDGIAYNGSGPVAPQARVIDYDKFNGSFGVQYFDTTAIPAIMDLRGAAQISPDAFVTIGGMEAGPKVSRRVFLFSWAYTVPTKLPGQAETPSISPNPATHFTRVSGEQPKALRLFDVNGKLLQTCAACSEIDLNTMPSGVLLLEIEQHNGLKTRHKLVHLEH